MKTLVRLSISTDMPQVLRLIKELAVFEKEPNAVKITVDTLVKEGFGKNPLFTCFVAEVEEGNSWYGIGLRPFFNLERTKYSFGRFNSK